MADLQKLDKAINELEEQSNSLKEFNKVYSEIGKLKQDLTNNLNILKENNQGLSSISTDIRKSLEDFEKELGKLETGLLKRIQELYNDNKSFQKELDASLVTRLDKHKSDIQIEIRNEGTQIQRAFENSLNSNFNLMDSKIKESFALQNNQLTNLKILAYITIGLGIGLAIGLYLK